jgi:TIR domain
MSLKVFISWSGNESQFVASQLRKLLKRLCSAAEPWISHDDLSAGTVWQFEILKQLQSTYFGIICVNRENMNSPWLHFEAGALAKSLDTTSVFPYLIGLPSSALSGPLTLFQSVNADKVGTFKLISALNKVLRERQEPSHEDADLQAVFDAMWPDYERELKESRKVPLDAGPERSNEDILSELVTTARKHSRLLSSILRASPSYRPPIQGVEQPQAIVPDEDLLSVSFEELRDTAKRLRLSGQHVQALEVFQQALALQCGDLETLIDVAVTETYLQPCDYEESIKKLGELVREHATRDGSAQVEESILAKAYYNLACIKHIARTEQDKPYTDADILDDLEMALNMYPAYINTAYADRDLARIKSHPRFKALLDKFRRAER